MEILHIIDAVAREKSLNKEVVILAMEEAMRAAGHKKYGNEYDIKVEISRKTGEIKLYRVLSVVENTENNFTEITVEEARKIDSEAAIGTKILDPLPAVDVGRTSAQIVRQVVMTKIKEAEQEKQYNDFKDRVGEILSGVVKRIEFGNIIVDFGKAEGIIKRDQLIKNETFKINDRVKAYVQSVRQQSRGPQIFLSRTDDRMLAGLLAIEVPEVAEQMIRVRSVVRDPGSRAKVAVVAVDTRVDPIGSCVGVRGSRIKSIIQELNGEKIDVVLWSDDLAQYVVNALKPIEASKVIIDEAKNKVEVVVYEKQLTEALGRRGQNIKLASRLVGWYIEVITDEEESQRKSEEFDTTSQLFVEALNVEELMAQMLVVRGFSSIEQIAAVDQSILSNIEGFNEEIAAELQKVAIEYVENRTQKLLSTLEALGVEQELLDNLDIKLEHIVQLAEYGIKTLEDMEELSVEEFSKIIPDSGLSNTEIRSLIDYCTNKNATNDKGISD